MEAGKGERENGRSAEMVWRSRRKEGWNRRSQSEEEEREGGMSGARRRKRREGGRNEWSKEEEKKRGREQGKGAHTVYHN